MKTIPLTDDLSKGYETPIFEPTWKYGAPLTKFTAHTLREGASGSWTSVGSIWDQ